jgi:hypothetical protein
MDLRIIEKRLALVLKNASGRLPAEQLAEMLSLVNAGEPGVALENFCTQLEEYDIVLPDYAVHELQDIAAVMGMKLPPWIGRGAP